jgi:RNA polymerase sigma-70 factor (ECF subfamily)
VKRGPESKTEFQDIYDAFNERIRRYLARLIGAADSEDLVQEVFLKVHAALGNFRGDSSLSTWIYRIATNAAMDHLRKSPPLRPEPAGGEASDDEIGPGEEEHGAERVPSLDTQVIRKEMNECIRGIVDGLPENYRAVLVLSDIEGFANKEIADVLGLSMETVKIRLHRARTRLKEELKHHCNFYRDDRNELACDRKPTPLKVLKK